jgi:hypothetical protein
MRHGLFTLALAAALTACSKPNPLFLDTWEGLSEGGSQITAVTTDDATATASSASSVDPTSTATTTIDETTTAGPTATSEPPTSTTGSTGQACASQTLELLPPARDTFVVRATDAGDSCTLDGSNGELFAGKCHLLDFGAVEMLSLFRGDDPIDEIERISAYLIDFPRDGAGQVIHGDVIPSAQLEQVALRLAYSDPEEYGFDQANVEVYALPLEFDGKQAEWSEGAKAGALCEAGSTFLCAQCKAGDKLNCTAPWFGLDAFAVPPAMFMVASAALPISGPNGDTFDIPLDPKLFGEIPHNGFVVVTKAFVKRGQILTNTPPGPLRMHAREFADANLRPGLVVQACL